MRGEAEAVGRVRVNVGTVVAPIAAYSERISGTTIAKGPDPYMVASDK